MAGSVILSIEEDDEIGEDELSFQENQTGAQTSSRNRNSSSGLAMATSASDGLNVSITAPNRESTRREVFGAIPAREPVVDPLPTIEDLEEDELSPERATKSQKSRRPARERPVMVKDDEDELSPPQVIKPKTSRKTIREPPVVPEGIVEGEVSEDELSPAQPKTRRQLEKAPIEARRKPNKRRRVEEPRIEVHQDEFEGEASEVDELSPQQTRPAPKRKPSKPRQPLSKATNNLPKRTKQPNKPASRATSPPRTKAKVAAIGIGVLRRTESQNIAYDTLASEPNPGITPIDVLAQVSYELVTNHITVFQQQARPDNVSKRVRKRQIGAMEYFRHVLDNTLLDLRIAYSGNHVLGKEVRGINKRKRQLREELMGRRREREEIEVEIDRVRARHREMVEKGDSEFELVQSLRDIEGAVKRGREKAHEEGRDSEGPDVGIEIAVGGARESLGLLGRVREWNGVLGESA